MDLSNKNLLIHVHQAMHIYITDTKQDVMLTNIQVEGHQSTKKRLGTSPL